MVLLMGMLLAMTLVIMMVLMMATMLQWDKTRNYALENLLQLEYTAKYIVSLHF